MRNIPDLNQEIEFRQSAFERIYKIILGIGSGVIGGGIATNPLRIETGNIAIDALCVVIGIALIFKASVFLVCALSHRPYAHWNGKSLHITTLFQSRKIPAGCFEEIDRIPYIGRSFINLLRSRYDGRLSWVRVCDMSSRDGVQLRHLCREVVRQNKMDQR